MFTSEPDLYIVYPQILKLTVKSWIPFVKSKTIEIFANNKAKFWKNWELNILKSYDIIYLEYHKSEGYSMEENNLIQITNFIRLNQKEIREKYKIYKLNEKKNEI